VLDENAALKLRVADLENNLHPPHISLSSEEDEEPLPLAGPQPLALTASHEPVEFPTPGAGASNALPSTSHLSGAILVCAHI